MRTDESVRMVQPVGGEEPGFLERGFVAEFHGLESQLSQFTVPPRLVGHHHVGEGKLTEKFPQNAGRFAFPGPVAALDRDQVHAQSSRWSSKSSLANRLTIMPNKINVGPTMIRPRLNKAPAARY